MDNNYETDLAHFTLPGPHLLEVRLKGGLHIDILCIKGLMQERARLCGKSPLCVVVLVPQDAELDLSVIGMDHYEVNESAEGLHAVAFVTDSLTMQTMGRLFKAYYPQRFQMEVFGQEAEARAWMAQRLEELPRSGEEA